MVCPTHEIHKIKCPTNKNEFTIVIIFPLFQVSLKEGDVCTILNNADSDAWQIRCGDGTETEVPGIVLVIPPPDKKAYNESQR